MVAKWCISNFISASGFQTALYSREEFPLLLIYSSVDSGILSLLWMRMKSLYTCNNICRSSFLNWSYLLLNINLSLQYLWVLYVYGYSALFILLVKTIVFLSVVFSFFWCFFPCRSLIFLFAFIYLFICGGTGVWAQGLHLEPLHLSFFVIFFSR
jgi:hypothetical protein